MLYYDVGSFLLGKFHQNASGYKSHTFHIDFDPFRMILTLISVANAYVIRCFHDPEQAWEPVGMWGSWGEEGDAGKRKVIYDKNNTNFFFFSLGR